MRSILPRYVLGKPLADFAACGIVLFQGVLIDVDLPADAAAMPAFAAYTFEGLVIFGKTFNIYITEMIIDDKASEGKKWEKE